MVGGISQKLFDAGALAHKKRAAVAALDRAAAQYRGTVLTAFQNVADALRALQSDAEALRAQAAAERAAYASFDLAQQQFKLGAIDYLTLLERGTHLGRCARPPGTGAGQSLSPIPPPCSRRWAAAGGIARTSSPDQRPDYLTPPLVSAVRN